MQDSRHIDVLLVDDRPGDVRLTKEAFHYHGKPIQFHHAWDSLEALQFLKREGSFQNAPRPDLIILDLHLSGKRGDEVLSWVKGDPRLKIIPTIIFTTSDLPADISGCYALGANCYLQKPVNWDKYEHLVTCIARFWLRRLPGPEMESAHQV